jgi:hypothetical protein
MNDTGVVLWTPSVGDIITNIWHFTTQIWKATDGTPITNMYILPQVTGYTPTTGNANSWTQLQVNFTIPPTSSVNSTLGVYTNISIGALTSQHFPFIVVQSVPVIARLNPADWAGGNPPLHGISYIYASYHPGSVVTGSPTNSANAIVA